MGNPQDDGVGRHILGENRLDGQMEHIETLGIGCQGNDETVRQGVSVSIEGIAAGEYEIRPYDTWMGAYLDSFSVACLAAQPCTIPLPDFEDDMAFKVIRKAEN